MIQVTAIVEAGTLAGDLISCKDVIGKTVDEISNVNTIVVSFKGSYDVPIENIEKINFDTINAITGDRTSHEVIPNEVTNVRIYHYGNTTIQAAFHIDNGKLVTGRAYASNQNIIEAVDDIKITAITFGGTTSRNIIPILQ